MEGGHQLIFGLPIYPISKKAAQADQQGDKEQPKFSLSLFHCRLTFDRVTDEFSDASTLASQLLWRVSNYYAKNELRVLAFVADRLIL
jgi:hypothetical protein